MKLAFKVNEREKKFLLIGGAAVLLIILYHGFSLYSDFRSNVVELSDAKRFMLEKQLQKLSEKDVVESQIAEVREQIEKQEKMFLRGSKPPVAAAMLQRFLKEKISSLKLEVKQERTLNPVDADVYLGIPVEIGFKASTEKLKEFLYSLRAAPYLLTVSELKIRVTNISNPVDVYVTVVVTGYIKKPADENEKVRNAA
jgi:Tfp pilus assembly protein PilO